MDLKYPEDCLIRKLVRDWTQISYDDLCKDVMPPKPTPIQKASEVQTSNTQEIQETSPLSEKTETAETTEIAEASETVTNPEKPRKALIFINDIISL